MYKKYTIKIYKLQINLQIFFNTKITMMLKIDIKKFIQIIYCLQKKMSII